MVATPFASKVAIVNKCQSLDVCRLDSAAKSSLCVVTGLNGSFYKVFDILIEE